MSPERLTTTIWCRKNMDEKLTPLYWPGFIKLACKNLNYGTDFTAELQIANIIKVLQTGGFVSERLYDLVP